MQGNTWMENHLRRRATGKKHRLLQLKDMPSFGPERRRGRYDRQGESKEIAGEDMGGDNKTPGKTWEGGEKTGQKKGGDCEG